MQPKLYPRLTLALLTGLNILNYIDRSVLFSVQPLIKKEFSLSDAQIGILTSVFFIFYMIAGPCVGWLGDRYPRKYIIASGIFIWSGFTLLTWFTHNFSELLFRHTVVGIGEASYAAIAPTVIADLFPLERRGRMLSVFYLGLPFGTALGYLVGGYLGDLYGWRLPFMVAGIPGFLLALALLLLPEPRRGSTEPADTSQARSSVFGLFKNGAYITVSLGIAMYSFAVGGLQVWIPTFLERVRGLSLERANLMFGGVAAFNGIVATLIGGWLGDRLLKRHYGAYYIFSGVAMFIAVPFMVLAIYVSGPLMFPMIFIAVFFLLIGTGPTNAALINSVSANIRSTALAVNLFVIHLLGDASSPFLIGKISDRTSLQTGFWATFVAAAISGVLLVYGARYAPRLQRSEAVSETVRL